MSAIVHAQGICTRDCDHAEVDAEQVEACRAWLRRHAQPRKTINTRIGSYGLKHAVERASERTGAAYAQIDPWGRRWTGSRQYVSNGALIAAALLEGYRMTTSIGSPNACFNLSIRRSTSSLATHEMYM